MVDFGVDSHVAYVATSLHDGDLRSWRLLQEGSPRQLAGLAIASFVDVLDAVQVCAPSLVCGSNSRVLPSPARCSARSGLHSAAECS